ncbi:MAG: M12 family metallo-peptidase [Hyphomicrobiaceae bacterium]
MLSRVPRTMLRVLSAFSLIAVLATAPSLSQAPQTKGDDRVELIMGGLPPAGSAEYKALLKFAGKAKGQVLSLTRTEMWSISRQRLAALQKAAAAKNVTVRVLDESWNQLLAPMPSTTPMEGTVKSMHDMAMQSRATGGVGMMATRTAGMVEYALTKGMDDKDAAKQPMSIKIAINEKTTITAVRQSVVINGDRCTWRGVVEGTMQPVTIMWWGSGRITGTIQHDNRIFQIKQFADNTIGVVESMMERMPEEHPKTSTKRMQDMKMQSDTLFMHGDTGAMRPRPKRSETDDAKDAPLAKPAPGIRTAVVGPKPGATAPVKGAPKSKLKLPDTVIDVMVVYTAKAARHYSDIRRDLIELAMEETNQSIVGSKINNVAVRLVHTHLTDYVEDGAEHFDHVWRMVDKGDGFMEELHRLRDEKKADVVILVVDDSSGCGLATRVAADADEAYAVVHHECAATSYSIAHEIGHIIGTRHDRSLDQNTHPFPNGHGFVSPDLKWRTMMSYKSGCNGCPRLPVWSTPDKVVEGKPAGDVMHNNAAVIRDNAGRVAGFR